MIDISKGGLSVCLAEPRSYYQGIRFDACGVFRHIIKDGYVFAGKWFDADDPLRHDNVCGPSEEFFGVYGYDEAPVGGSFLKVGVGLLRKESDAPYDWFHLYGLADGGRFSLQKGGTAVEYSHAIDGFYRYVKKIEILSEDSFAISHKFAWLGPGTIELLQYCHNFFTFGDVPVGPSRRIDFPAKPYGTWREDSTHGYQDGTSLLYDVEILPGEKAYIGNLQLDPDPGHYSLVLSEGERSVEIKSDRPLDHMVMWACRRVACPEPYVRIHVDEGAEASWTNIYKLK